MIKLRNDGYDYARMPKSVETKKRMSDAKKGRKYSDRHRANMSLTQVVKYAVEHDRDPIEYITNHPRFSDEVIANLLALYKEKQNAEL